MRSLLLPVATLTAACIGEPLYVGGTGGSGVGGLGFGGGDTSATTGVTSSSTGSGSSSSGSRGVCGDWDLEGAEVCEDGNVFPGDGCDPDCQLEAFCGNGVVEPGEKCDSVACDAACEPTAESGCFGALEIPYGTYDFIAGPTIPALGSCAAKLGRHVGWVDTGPTPMRIAGRFAGTSENIKLALGCQQVPIDDCMSTVVTDPLPPHSIVWVGFLTSAEGDARSFQLFLTRWGNWFGGGGAGMTTTGEGGVTWAWSTNDSGVWLGTATAAGVAYLVSPVVDLSGIDVATAHFDSQFAPGPGATGSVEFSTDGQSWMPAAVIPSGNVSNTEVVLDGAAGQPTVQVRFVYDATSAGTWTIRNLFIGPPVPM